MISNKLLYSLTTTISISFAIFFKKMALEVGGVSPIKLLLQLMIIAAIILNINFFLFHKHKIKEIITIDKRKSLFIVMAGISLFLAYLSSTLGLRFTTSINYSFITRSTLIFTTFLATIFLKEKINVEKTVLIISFFVGIYLVTTGGKAIIPNIGDLLILVGAFFFSTFSVTQKKVSSILSSETISWGVTSCSAILSLLTIILFKISLWPFKGFLFVFLTGICEALFVLFMNKTIHVANVTYYAMMTMLIPIINGFLGFIFLNELLNSIQLLGGFTLIISGILVQRLKS